MKDLAAANATHPRGRIFHVVQPRDDVWSVVDVWESQDRFEAFGATLMPIMAKNGMTNPTIEVRPTHNVVRAPA